MQNKKGFTLIEILVVIAIIGILAATILVLMRNANQKTKDNQVLTMMQSAAAAIQVCLSNQDPILRNGVAQFISASESNFIHQLPLPVRNDWWNFNNTPIAGTKICLTSADSLWPDISSQGWHYVTWVDIGSHGGSGGHYFNNYYWIEATNADYTKWIICEYSPSGWAYNGYVGTQIVTGNLTYKCTKIGF